MACEEGLLSISSKSEKCVDVTKKYRGRPKLPYSEASGELNDGVL